jgi:tetratricopeptide (TPR) repeat protein
MNRIAPGESAWATAGRERLLRAGLATALVAWLAAAPGCAAQQIEPAKANTRLELAMDFLRKGQLEAAEQEARRGLGFNPRDTRAHNVLGLVGFLRALANFRLLEVEDCLTGSDAQDLRTEMERYLLQAEDYLRTATELSPEYGDAWSNRASVAMQLGEFARAIPQLQQALAHPMRLQNPALTRAHLGWSLYHLGRYPQATKELRQALQFQPDMCVATYRLGRVYFARKEWDKALEQFLKVSQRVECPLQEARLYLLKTYIALDMKDRLPRARQDCIALAEHSCIAAQCRAIEP